MRWVTVINIILIIYVTSLYVSERMFLYPTAVEWCTGFVANTFLLMIVIMDKDNVDIRVDMLKLMFPLAELFVIINPYWDVWWKWLRFCCAVLLLLLIK